MSYKIRDILILMSDRHMGNLVVSIPAIRSIRESFRDVRLHLLVDSAYKEIVETLNIDNLMLYPRRQLREGTALMRLMTYLRFIYHLRDIKPDIAIDLEGREYSSVLTFLSGASIRYGPSTSKRAFLYNRRIEFSNNKHKLYKYLDIASATGARARTEFNLRPSDEKRASLRQKLMDYGIDLDRPIICIHPGAGKIYKQWSVEGFATISDWLSSKGIQVVFVGGDNDIEDIKKIESLAGYPFHNTAGRISLGELMALFEISTLYIGNDSGPMHLAGAMGLPVIALFGPADERRWGPLSDRRIILRGEEPCQRCRGRRCEYEFRCIKAIAFNDVKTAVQILLGREEKIAE